MLHLDESVKRLESLSPSKSKIERSPKMEEINESNYSKNERSVSPLDNREERNSNENEKSPQQKRHDQLIKELNLVMDHHQNKEHKIEERNQQESRLLPNNEIRKEDAKNDGVDTSQDEEVDEFADISEELINKKYNEYILKRQYFISEVQNTKYGGLTFTTQEERANKIFRKLVKNLKSQLPDCFYKEFTMKYKEMIEKSNIYKILKKMPKGANLHLHVDTAFDPDWVQSF